MEKLQALKAALASRKKKPNAANKSADKYMKTTAANHGKAVAGKPSEASEGKDTGDKPSAKPGAAFWKMSKRKA